MITFSKNEAWTQANGVVIRVHLVSMPGETYADFCARWDAYLAVVQATFPC